MRTCLGGVTLRKGRTGLLRILDGGRLWLVCTCQRHRHLSVEFMSPPFSHSPASTPHSTTARLMLVQSGAVSSSQGKGLESISQPRRIGTCLPCVISDSPRAMRPTTSPARTTELQLITRSAVFPFWQWALPFPDEGQCESAREVRRERAC